MRDWRLLVALVATLCSATITTNNAQTPPAQTPARTVPPPKTPQKTTSKAQPLPAAAASPTSGWDERVLRVPVVGQATAYVPKQATDNVVLFVSGDGGWNLGVVDMARRIMPKAIVIGVSYVALRKAHVGETRCWLPAGDLEEISHAAQKQLNLTEYRPPIVIGYSSGATLVYEVLASAPASTFAGGLSLGFCPDLPADHPVCPADNFKPTFDAKKNTAWLPKVARLPRDFFVLNGEQDQVCLPPAMHEFLDDMVNAHFIEVPGTGHGFSRPVRWGQPFDEAVDKLLTLSKKSAAPPPPATMTGRTGDLENRLNALGLPLQYQWSDTSHAVLVFISGDGGWATIDDRVAAYLASHGVSVVGLSTLRYFWKAKTPAQAGADLGHVVGALTNAKVPIFLGGYSFGAEVTPFIIGAWSEADRRRVNGQVLIAPGETASFEVSPLDWVFRAKPTAMRVPEQARALHLPTLCIAGQTELAADTACDNIGTAAELVRLPGSHHFNGNYDAVAQAVLKFIDATIARPKDLHEVMKP